MQCFPRNHRYFGERPWLVEYWFGELL
jgi:hypothetical protein